jgi:anti-sigma regulatory factor (Ser/Thr protein kinase)
MKSVRLPALMDDLPRMMEWILDFMRENGFPSARIQEIELASEEALINIIRHAYAGRESGEVEIRCRAGTDHVEIDFVDDGVAFDPTSKARPQLDLPIEERQVGGLGIFLIRNLIHEIHYRREGGQNIFTWVVHKQRGG